MAIVTKSSRNGSVSVLRNVIAAGLIDSPAPKASKPAPKKTSKPAKPAPKASKPAPAPAPVKPARKAAPSLIGTAEYKGHALVTFSEDVDDQRPFQFGNGKAIKLLAAIDALGYDTVMGYLRVLASGSAPAIKANKYMSTSEFKGNALVVIGSAEGFFAFQFGAGKAAKLVAASDNDGPEAVVKALSALSGK